MYGSSRSGIRFPSPEIPLIFFLSRNLLIIPIIFPMHAVVAGQFPQTISRVNKSQKVAHFYLILGS